MTGGRPHCAIAIKPRSRSDQPRSIAAAGTLLAAFHTGAAAAGRLAGRVRSGGESENGGKAEQKFTHLNVS
jgi:hypothetical protein